jgi:hypothetical protein
VEIIDFAKQTNIGEQSEIDRTKLACYFEYKRTGKTMFCMNEICDLLLDFGFNRPNASRLKAKLIKGNEKIMLSKNAGKELEFIPIVLQKLESDYGNFWDDTVSIKSNSELIDEVKFGGKKPYIDRIIKQINFTYDNNCYDACAVLMRRLFEILLVLAYQRNGVEQDITNAQGHHLMLEGIVKNAKLNTTLNFSSRVKNNFDTFREVGNNSAHSITYTASKKDIDDIKITYRVMLDELYDKAGIS